MAYRIGITRSARRDAQEYATFVRDGPRSPEAARRWLDGLYAAIKGLDESPARHSVVPEAEELGFPYRSFIDHSHRVVYAVDEAGRRVTVHRIYHGARRSLGERDLPEPP